MSNSQPDNTFDDEHKKRDSRITEQQRRIWADGLLAFLPDSAAYRQACTPQARLKEQALLNQLVDQWQREQLQRTTNPSALLEIKDP